MVSPFCAASRDYRKKIKKNRLPYAQREKAAVIKLRRLGYTIPTLAAFTGRSYSTIHRILKQSLGALVDFRKNPLTTRNLTAQIQRNNIGGRLQAWIGFILGSEDEPP